MLDYISSETAMRFWIASAAVGLCLIALVAVLYFMRNRPSSPFVRGGRNRVPRLAVMDAAAVDARRRLVLIRRDNVEHLVMIGGPVDFVIESGIRVDAAQQAGMAVEPASLTTPVVPTPVVTAPVVANPVGATPVAAATPVVTATPVSAEPVRQTQRPDDKPREEKAVPVAATRSLAESRYMEHASEPAPAVTAPRAPVSEPRPLPAASVAARNVSMAEDVLDAVRARVLSRPEPVLETPPMPQPLARPAPLAEAAKPAAQRPVELDTSSDFEKFLQAEMDGTAKPSASDFSVSADSRFARPANPAATQTERRDPPITGASAPSDLAIDHEMSRILGELSVNRK